MKHLKTLVAVLAVAMLSTSASGQLPSSPSKGSVPQVSGVVSSVNPLIHKFVLGDPNAPPAKPSMPAKTPTDSYVYNDATKFVWDVPLGSTQPTATANSDAILVGSAVKVSYSTDTWLGSKIALVVAVTPLKPAAAQ